MTKKIVLSCMQCGNRNYTVPTSKESTSIRIERKNTARIVTLIHFINKLYEYESKIDFPCGGLAKWLMLVDFLKM